MPRTKKPSESKYKGRKITDTGRENEQQEENREENENPQYRDLLLRHASRTKLSFGDWTRRGTFLVVTSQVRKTGFMNIFSTALCILLPSSPVM